MFYPISHVSLSNILHGVIFWHWLPLIIGHSKEGVIVLVSVVAAVSETEGWLDNSQSAIVAPSCWRCWSIITTITISGHCVGGYGHLNNDDDSYRRLKRFKVLLYFNFIANNCPTRTARLLAFLFHLPHPALAVPHSPADLERSDRRASATTPWPVDLTWWHKMAEGWQGWHQASKQVKQGWRQALYLNHTTRTFSQRKVCNEKAEAIKSLAEIGGLDSRALEVKCKNGSGLSDPSKKLNKLCARKLWKQIGANKWRRYPKPAIVAIAAETPLAKPIPHSSHQNIIVGGSQLVRGGNKGGKCAYFNVMIIHYFGVMFLYLCTG